MVIVACWELVRGLRRRREKRARLGVNEKDMIWTELNVAIQDLAWSSLSEYWDERKEKAGLLVVPKHQRSVADGRNCFVFDASVMMLEGLKS